LIGAVAAVAPRLGDRALRLLAAAAAVALAAAVVAVDGRTFASGLLLGIAVALVVAAARAPAHDAHTLTDEVVARLGDAWSVRLDDVADATGERGHVVAGPRAAFRLTSRAVADASDAPALVDAARGAAWAAAGRTGLRIDPLVVVWHERAPAEARVGGVDVVRGDRLAAWLAVRG
jgi:hypothetical protein